jgi:hypothetical protein
MQNSQSFQMRIVRTMPKTAEKLQMPIYYLNRHFPWPKCQKKFFYFFVVFVQIFFPFWSHHFIATCLYKDGHFGQIICRGARKRTDPPFQKFARSAIRTDGFSILNQNFRPTSILRSRH